MPLEFLKSIKPAGGGLIRSPRIEIEIRSSALPSHLREIMPLGTIPLSLTLKFRAGGRDEYLSELESAIKAGVWNKSVVVEQKQIKVEGYGIGGISRALNEDTKERNQTLSSGFKDLRSLSENSRELKGLAGKLKQLEESKDPELEEIKATMASLGFASGVTKEIAGKNYIPQLSREICDFIKGPLENSGGLLLILDAYCLYNRARGGNLISPEEMNQACELFETLQLPVKVKMLGSGTKALQLGGQAMENLTKKIVEGVKEKDHLSAKEASEFLKISPIIALECLSLAENQGLLCRDQGLQGLHFYKNLFLKPNDP